MKHLVIVHGPPGVGKSTLTGLLREQLQEYAYVDRPYIKRGLKPAGKDVARRLSKEASYLLISRLVELGKDIIAEEVDPESVFKNIGERFFSEHGYTLIPFRLTCTVEAAIKRDIERDAKTIGEEGVREMHAGYAVIKPYEVVIDTEKNGVEDCLAMMLRRIRRED